MKKYNLIGLTGTTGAGKGVAVEVFKENGYYCIDADCLARKIMENPIVLNCLCDVFGGDIVQSNTLNRKLLAQRAFKSKEATQKLNLITHPFIDALFVDELSQCNRKKIVKIVFDAPQLFESKLDVLCDRIVGVLADKNIRVNRILERDNLTVKQAESRIDAQYDDEFFKRNCDYVAYNNSTVIEFKEKVQMIIDEIQGSLE